MSPGDIDRELTEMIVIHRNGSTTLRRLVERAFELGEAHGRSVAESTRAAEPTPVPGHGGTVIQKVEIVLTSNQSPSRIARAVHAALTNLVPKPKEPA